MRWQKYKYPTPPRSRFCLPSFLSTFWLLLVIQGQTVLAPSFIEKHPTTMTLLRSGRSCEQSRAFPSFPKLPREIRDMIWSMALPSKRFIVDENMSHHPHRKPALLSVNREARAMVLKHYTMHSINTNYRHLNEIRELYIDFRVDAFAYDTVDPRRAFSISNDIFADDDDLRAQKSFQKEITSKVCTIVISLRELNVQSFEQKLWRTGFCKGLLPSLQEMILYVPDTSTCGAAKRKLRKQRLGQQNSLLEELFCKIKTSFDKWVGQCQHCIEHNLGRSVVNKPLKLTFATSPGGEFPAELVPLDGKYHTTAEWFLW